MSKVTLILVLGANVNDEDFEIFYRDILMHDEKTVRVLKMFNVIDVVNNNPCKTVHFESKIATDVNYAYKPKQSMAIMIPEDFIDNHSEWCVDNDEYDCEAFKHYEKEDGIYCMIKLENFELVQ